MSQIELIFDIVRNNQTLQWLGTFFFTVGISTFISWYFGDRWNYANERKKQHTEVLKNEALIPWYTNITNYVKSEVRINVESGKYESESFVDPNNIPYGEYLFQHLLSGYSSLLEKWESLKQIVYDQNMETAMFYDEMLNDFKSATDELGLLSVYQTNGIDDPCSYVSLPSYIQGMIKAYEEKTTWKRDWDEVKPVKGTDFDDNNLFRLNWGSGRFMRDSDPEKIDRVMDKIIREFDNVNYIEKYEKIKKDKYEVEIQRNKFRALLDKEIKKIDLGQNIKGKCSLC